MYACHRTLTKDEKGWAIARRTTITLRPGQGRAAWQLHRARAWAEAKAKEKAKIARIAAEASEKAEAKEEARVTEKAYATKRAAEEAVADIRARAEAERAKR